MSDVIGTIVLVIGLIFNLLGCVGLIKFPDVYNRIHAATKCVTLGTCMVLLSVVIFAGFVEHASLAVKCLMCIVFVWITSPTSAHSLARAAYSFGVKLWEKSVVDHYHEDKVAAAEPAAGEPKGEQP